MHSSILQYNMLLRACKPNIEGQCAAGGFKNKWGFPKIRCTIEGPHKEDYRMSIGKLPNVCNKTMRSGKVLATLTQDGFARIASAELTHTTKKKHAECCCTCVSAGRKIRTFIMLAGQIAKHITSPTQQLMAKMLQRRLQPSFHLILQVCLS